MKGIDPSAVQGYADSIISLINGILVPVLMSVAFIVFLYGVYKYFMQGADSETERETGRTFALYGIIGFVILFTVWGIVNIFMSTLNLRAINAQPPPTIWGGSSTPNGASRPLFQTGGNAVGGGYAPGYMNNGGTNAVSSTQLNQLYSALQTCESQNGSGSQQCLSAYDTYMQAYNAFQASSNTGGDVYCPDGSQVTNVADCPTDTSNNATENTNTNTTTANCATQDQNGACLYGVDEYSGDCMPDPSC